jgi:histidine triad (HIT) family protein
MTESVFSKIIKREIPAEIVYEDEDFIAFLDINPINIGHTLLVPKKFSTDLFEMNTNDLEKVGLLLKILGESIKKSMGAKGLNIAMNNGKVAGQEVPHAHFHLVPRFENDGYKLWSGKPYKKDEMKEVANKIRGEI